MNAPTKKRLCWNCEARVSLSEENCTYCGVYLSPATFPGLQQEDDIPAPMYKPEGETSIPKSPYGEMFEEHSSHKSSQTSHQQLPAAPELIFEPLKSVALSLGLLLGGSIFFLFGLILFLFSAEDTFTLQWNASYWYVYLLLSAPMLYFGWLKSHGE
jgi:hypothetical protein